MLFSHGCCCVQDTLLPDAEGMARFKPMFDEFKAALDYDAPAGGGGGEEGEEKKPRKRAAAAATEEYDGDWVELLSSDANMKKVTMPVLKAKLKQEGKEKKKKRRDQSNPVFVQERKLGATRASCGSD